MAKELSITIRLPMAKFEQPFEQRLAELGISASAYGRELIARDLGISEDAWLSTVVDEELFEDIHAAVSVLRQTMPERIRENFKYFSLENLLAAFVQFHAERDTTLFSWESFAEVYKYPHKYVRRQKNGNGQTT